jgi:hypothetical protein
VGITEAGCASGFAADCPLSDSRRIDKNELNSDVFTGPAEKGRMLIWPSHIPHAVEQGAADESEDRFVVAFNIMIRGLIQMHTARLDLR